MTYVTKEHALTPNLEAQDLDVEGLGTVRVRKLSRAEGLEIGKIDGAANIECATIARGLVEPKLTDEEAKAFQQAHGFKVVGVISDKILEISGMLKGADETAYKSDNGEPPEPVV